MDFNLSPTQTTALVIAAVWELIWKGLALWRSSQKRDLAWFVAILIINSVGILPIIYLLMHREDKTPDEEVYDYEEAVPLKR